MYTLDGPACVVLMTLEYSDPSDGFPKKATIVARGSASGKFWPLTTHDVPPPVAPVAAPPLPHVMDSTEGNAYEKVAFEEPEFTSATRTTTDQPVPEPGGSVTRSTLSETRVTVHAGIAVKSDDGDTSVTSCSSGMAPFVVFAGGPKPDPITFSVELPAAAAPCAVMSNPEVPSKILYDVMAGAA